MYRNQASRPPTAQPRRDAADSRRNKKAGLAAAIARILGATRAKKGQKSPPGASAPAAPASSDSQQDLEWMLRLMG